MVVEPKRAQLIEQDEKPIDLFNSIGWRVQKPFLSFKMFVPPIKVEFQPIDIQSRDGRGPTITNQALNING